jgi:hypothetical protein
LNVSKLDDLIGLNTVKRTVRRLASPESSTHAVLFYGGQGSGKTTISQILAKSWLCESPANGEACGACKACRSHDKGQNADFLLVKPLPPSNLIRLLQIVPSQREKDQPHIPVTVMLRTPPIASRHKVILIEDADRMNSDSANALLKSLEEPFEYARFILTSSALSRILPTIRSRCMSVSCPFPMAQEMPETVNEHLADISDGSLGEMKRIAEKPEIYEAVYSFASTLQSRQPYEALASADEFRKICERWADAYDIAARKAQTEALAQFARYIMKLRPDQPNWIQSIAEVHRRIQQNAHPLATFDALFAEMLLGQ